MEDYEKKMERTFHQLRKQLRMFKVPGQARGYGHYRGYEIFIEFPTKNWEFASGYFMMQEVKEGIDEFSVLIEMVHIYPPDVLPGGYKVLFLVNGEWMDLHQIHRFVKKEFEKLEATAGEVDWRPAETVPEDHYA